MDVFGIEKRYKAKPCTKNDGKYWLVQALVECANGGTAPQKIIQKMNKTLIRIRGPKQRLSGSRSFKLAKTQASCDDLLAPGGGNTSE